MSEAATIISVVGAAAVALLTIALQLIIRTVGRVERAHDLLAQQVSAMEQRVAGQLASVTQRLDTIASRLDDVRGELVTLRHHVDTLKRAEAAR